MSLSKISLTLGLSLTALALVACGGNPPAYEPQSAPVATSTYEPAPSPRQTTPPRSIP